MPPTRERTLSQTRREQSAQKKKRLHYVKGMTRVRDEINEQDFSTKTLFQLEELLTALEDNWRDYKDEYAKIFDEMLEEDESEKCEKDFVDAEKIFSSARTKIRTRIAEITPAARTANPQEVTVKVQQSNARDIPNSWGHFSGNYAAWPAFRDRFKARIHDKSEIPIADKWAHLRSSLSGEALRSLARWDETDENYPIAWKWLCTQYKDRYMAVQTLIEKLLSIPKLSHASRDGIRNIIDTVHECLTQLSAYVSVKDWDPLIIFLVVDKLDHETRKDWERIRRDLNPETPNMGSNSSLNNAGAVGGISNASNPNASNSVGNTSTNNANAITQVDESDEPSDTLPTWLQMEQFLDQQAKILRDIAKTTPNMHNQQGNANRGQQRKQNAPNAQGNQNAQDAQRTNENLPPCLLCRVKHPTFSCPTWKGMSVEDREMFQKSNGLCITCVQPAHGKSPCWGKANWAKRCPVCNEHGEVIYHNSTLCRRTENKRLQKTLTMQFPTNAKPNGGNKKA